MTVTSTIQDGISDPRDTIRVWPTRLIVALTYLVLWLGAALAVGLTCLSVAYESATVNVFLLALVLAWNVLPYLTLRYVIGLLARHCESSIHVNAARIAALAIALCGLLAIPISEYAEFYAFAVLPGCQLAAAILLAFCTLAPGARRALSTSTLHSAPLFDKVVHPLRWLLLFGGLYCLAWAVLALTGLESDWLMVLIWLGIFLGTQLLFLAPRRHWPIRLAERGRPMKLSILWGAAAGGLLSLGMLATILECPDWWHDLKDIIDQKLLYIALGTWAVWSIIFYAYWRGGDRYGQLGRLVRWLLGGSVLELLASTFVQAFIPDRHGCYCDRGSFFGMIIGLTVLLWTFGPGLALIFLYEKVRQERIRQWRKHPECPKCAYDLRGTFRAGRRECPECGQPVSRTLAAGIPHN